MTSGQRIYRETTGVVYRKEAVDILTLGGHETGRNPATESEGGEEYDG